MRAAGGRAAPVDQLPRPRGPVRQLWAGMEQLAVSTVLALTNVAIADAPERSPALHQAYEDEPGDRGSASALPDHPLGPVECTWSGSPICCLSCTSGYRLAGCAAEAQIGGGGGASPSPLTQETVADALGLTSVHLSRTLQLARRNNGFDWRDGRVVLHDPARPSRGRSGGSGAGDQPLDWLATPRLPDLAEATTLPDSKKCGRRWSAYNTRYRFARFLRGRA